MRLRAYSREAFSGTKSPVLAENGGGLPFNHIEERRNSAFTIPRPSCSTWLRVLHVHPHILVQHSLEFCHVEVRRRSSFRDGLRALCHVGGRYDVERTRKYVGNSLQEAEQDRVREQTTQQMECC